MLDILKNKGKCSFSSKKLRLTLHQCYLTFDPFLWECAGIISKTVQDLGSNKIYTKTQNIWGERIKLQKLHLKMLEPVEQNYSCAFYVIDGDWYKSATRQLACNIL